LRSYRALIAAAPLLLAVGCSTTPASPSAPSAGAPAASAGAASAPASSAPAVSAPTGSSDVNIVLTNAGCPPDRASVPAGTIVFNVSNVGGDAVSEVELLQNETSLGERENLAPGLSGSFTLVLQPGSYVLECPGATTPKTPFEVIQGQ
jgi:iron uptake system component EfeO